MVKKNELQQRWESNAIQVEKLFLGEISTSPFGRTKDGFEDFRGIVLTENMRPVDLQLNSCDFSYLSAKRLILANSSIENCRFDNAQFALGDCESYFRKVSFVKSKLQGSGIGATGSHYLDCDFSRADLTGMTGHGGYFKNCFFDATKFKNALMGGCSFENCRFVGNIEKVIFGGRTGAEMINCDFRKASFIDCTFYDMHFDSCQTSDETLIILEWSSVLAKFKVISSQHSDPDISNVCQRWIRVWEQILEHTPENIIDLADVTKREGPVIGQAMFRLFQKISA